MDGELKDSTSPTSEDREKREAIDPSMLDEDLFDFDETSLEPVEGAAPDLLQGEATLEEIIEASTAAPAATTDPVDIFDAEPIAAPTSELDEDIFGFDKLQDSTESSGDLLQHSDLIPDPVANQDETAEANLDDPIVPPQDPAAKPESDPASSILDEPIVPASAPDVLDDLDIEDEAPPRAPARPPGAMGSPKVTTPSTDPKAEYSRARQTADEALALAQAGRQAADRGIELPVAPSDGRWNTKMVISIAAAFLLVNASLVLVATQLSRSMNQALDDVRTDLSRSVAARAEVPVQVVLPEQTIQQATPTNTVQAAETVPNAGPQNRLPDVAMRELEIARQELDDRDFPSARKRLYKLLANRDRLLISAELLAEIDFLIPESYQLEAKFHDQTEEQQ